MTPEGQLKKDIKDYLKEVGAFWSMVTGGAYSKEGDPDIVVCYKGCYIAIEAKTYTGKMSPIQTVRRTQIIDAGGIHICARSVDDVKKTIEKIDTEPVQIESVHIYK